MIDRPVKKRRDLKYRVWGLLLTALWLSLHTVVLAEGDAFQKPGWLDGAGQALIRADAPSPAAEETVLPAVQNSVIKTDVQYAVDFAYLQAVAPNSVAWLYQPGTTINQHVMYSIDSGYYLRRTFNDRISSNGAIYAAGDEAPDFSASVTVLYGRNCLDYSLFGSLSYYQDDAYYHENPTLYLLTPEGDYQLDVFAGVRTKLSADDPWPAPADSDAAALTDSLPGILENSFIQPKASSLPVEGDAWAILATASDVRQGTRYVIYARKRPIDYATAKVAYVNKLEMDSRSTLNGYVSIENVGTWMLYAQNDPLWENLIFEAPNSSKRRTFGDGGCGPTAVAMAIANLVGEEDLVKLSAYASSPFGYRFCSSSVNDYLCSGKQLPYRLTTPDEYLRYFPLAIASFATGNNVWGVQGRTVRFGTNMRYLSNLCQVYDLSMTKTYHLDEALTALQNDGTIAVACSSGYGSPFTGTSHFLVLATVNDGYLYVLDPLRRDSYQATDHKNYLEVLAPGLVRIRLENVAQCNISPIYLLTKNVTP
jgi:sortase B